ncbi:MAG: hypothetical protein LKE27_00095 [Atopobiaceae bacterium]|nr:hypothetical protein [Atopobiaceae bacterium]
MGGKSIADAAQQGTVILWQFGCTAPAAINIFLLSGTAAEPALEHGVLIRFRMKRPWTMLAWGLASLIAAEALAAGISAAAEILAGLLLGWQLVEPAYACFLAASALLSDLAAAVYCTIGALFQKDSQDRTGSSAAVMLYIVSCVAVAVLPVDSVLSSWIPASWSFSTRVLADGLAIDPAAMLRACSVLGIWLLAAATVFFLLRKCIDV